MKNLKGTIVVAISLMICVSSNVITVSATVKEPVIAYCENNECALENQVKVKDTETDRLMKKVKKVSLKHTKINRNCSFNEKESNCKGSDNHIRKNEIGNKYCWMNHVHQEHQMYNRKVIHLIKTSEANIDMDSNIDQESNEMNNAKDYTLEDDEESVPESKLRIKDVYTINL